MSGKQSKKPPKSSKKEEKSDKHPGGRPTKANRELYFKLCSLIAIGYTNRQACDACNVTRSRFYEWIEKDEEFRDQYAKACDIRLELMADDLTEIADDGTNDWMEREKEHGEMHLVFNGEHFQRSRLRVDTRKWILSKLKPKKYGDKVDVEHSGGINITVTVGEKK